MKISYILIVVMLIALAMVFLIACDNEAKEDSENVIGGNITEPQTDKQEESMGNHGGNVPNIKDITATAR